MGLEFAFIAAWGIQLLPVIVLALFAVAADRWFAAAGMILGFIAAFAPLSLALVQGRGAVESVLLTVFLSTAVLIVAYGVSRKWKPFIATVVILAIPLACSILAAHASNPALNFLSLVGQLEFMGGPIICALVGRELLGWLDHHRCCFRSA